MERPPISFIIPIYNEELSIRHTFQEISEVIAKIPSHHFEIIAVNDASTDKSKEVLNQLQNIKVIHHTTNRGYGAAIKSGIKAAAGEWIAIVDCDETYPIKDFPQLVAHLDEYDMIVGARTGKSVKTPFFRKPAKFFLRLLANYLANTKIPDLNSGFRIFKKEIALRFFSLFPDGFSFTTTITIACLTNNYKVKFISINYEKREGKSSIRPIRDFLNFLILIVRLITYFKPLNVFLPISVVLFIAGFIKLMIDFVQLNHFGAGAVMTILVALQLFFLGLVADLIIKRTSL